MIRKIEVTFLSVVICLATVASALAMEYKEAPMLRTKVAAGKLPPVEERLPEEPLVVKPVEEIGQYGGVWRQVHGGMSDLGQNNYIMVEHLVRFSPDFKQILPNLVKSFKQSEDGKSVTFLLRKGMKWSDGAPFTADDFMFWWNDIILNDELTPTKSSAFKIGGELMKMEKLNDYTIKLIFSKPYGAYIESIAGMWAPDIMYAPKHYLRQFHPKYTPMEEIKKEMKKEGFTRWIDLFGAKNRHFNNPGCPQIDAWIPLNTIDKPIQILHRNPYYWKVDTEGNQLPYIDEVQRTLIPNIEAMLLKAIAGEVDFQTRRIESLKNYPLVKENEKKGNYRVIQFKTLGTNIGTMFLNYFSKDPILRKLFWDKRFRVALSIALDRNEINELLFKGIATSAQGTPPPGSAWYDEQIANLYTEYDPKRANELLDEIGLKWDKNHEYRLRPDGKRLRLIMNPFTPFPEESTDISELCKRKYWKDIGIEVAVKPLDRALWFPRIKACEHEVALYALNTGWPGHLPLNNQVFPLDFSYLTAPMWGLWFASEGKSGEEPPAEVKRMLEIYNESLETTSLEKRNNLIKEAFKISGENLLNIGVMRQPVIGRFFIAKNNFRNVREDSMSGELSYYQPSTFFLKK